MNIKAYLIFLPPAAQIVPADEKGIGVTQCLVIPDMRLSITEREDALGITHYGAKQAEEIEQELEKLRIMGCTINEVSLTEDNAKSISDYARQYAGIKDIMRELAEIMSVPA